MSSSCVTLVFATNNLHKLREARQILGGGFDVVSLKSIGCEDDLPETGDTLEFNSMQKARYVHEKYGVICFADDTGLEVEALDGRPGVYSARYAGSVATSADNITKLLQELKGEANRKARFRTVITLVGMGDTVCFEGQIKGEITAVRSGENGFGYDSVFVPEGQYRTFAEMPESEKNSFSHRSLALHQLQDYLKV